MPFLVQHLSSSSTPTGGDTTTKLQQTLSSTSILYPSNSSTIVTQPIGYCIPSTNNNEGNLTIISPHTRTPKLSTIEKGTISIDPRSSTSTVKDTIITNHIDASIGRTSVPYVTVVNSTGNQSNNNDHKSIHTNYTLLFGGAKPNLSNIKDSESKETEELINTTTIINVDTGVTKLFSLPSHSASSHDSTDTTHTNWPSPRKHAAACCAYKAVSPHQATALSQNAVETTTNDAKAKDKKVAPSKGKGGKDSSASVIDDSASVAPSHPLTPALPTPTIILFGGMGNDETLYDDLYICNTDETNLTNYSNNPTSTTLWNKITPKHGPAPGPRAHHTLTTTASSNRVILFGGYGYTEPLTPAVHAPVQPAVTAPSPAKGGKDAHPPINTPPPPTTVAHTKPTAPPQLLNDIWVLDCTSWVWTSVLITGPAPAPRCRHTAVSNAFLADSRMLKHNPYEITVGLDVRPLLPIYEHLSHLLHNSHSLVPSGTHSSLHSSNATSLNASPGPDHPANKPPAPQSTKGSVKSGKDASVPDHDSLTAATNNALLHSGLPSFLIEPNPYGADVLFVFGGACAPTELAASFAEARKEVNKDNVDNVNKMATRADDMMDGTVHVLVIDAALAEAVSSTHEDKDTAVHVHEPVPEHPSEPEHAHNDPKAKGGAPAKPNTRPASAKGEKPADAPAPPSRKHPIAAWTTLAAMTYQMLGGTSVEVNSPDAIELPVGVDMGESVSTVPSILTNPNQDSMVPYNGSSTPSLNSSRPSSRPNSRPASRLTYKAMARKRNDTYLRRMNATASSFVISHPTEPDQLSPHDSFASIPSSIPGAREDLSYYIILYGGITDVHVRNAASRLSRKTKGPADDPLVNSLIPTGISLELVDQDTLKRRVASPVSTHYDGFGGIILRERQFDNARGMWSLEIVRRIYPDGSVYEGESDAGVRSGKGKMEWNNIPGVSPPSAFVKYIGEWWKDIPHGRGIMYYADGSVYDGTWSNGTRQGNGVCHWDTTDMQHQYDQHADDEHQHQYTNIPHSHQGISTIPTDFTESDGVVSVQNWNFLSYEGDWYQNVPHGQGTIHFQNGGKYSGALENGMVEGQGELIIYVPSHNVHITVNGKWSHGLLQGNSLWKKEVSSEHSLEALSQHHQIPGLTESYQGPFVNGVREGPDAVVDFADGSHYRGPYRAGRRNGIAEVRYPNKDVYNGKFVGDKRNGKGTLLKCNGDVYTGLWKDDVMHGEGTYRFTVSGEVLLGTWVNGRFAGKSPNNTPKMLSSSHKFSSTNGTINK